TRSRFVYNFKFIRMLIKSDRDNGVQQRDEVFVFRKQQGLHIMRGYIACAPWVDYIRVHGLEGK
ncbi:hypothetical protein Q6247_26995, partial [Klebsiella pneumoniae]